MSEPIRVVRGQPSEHELAALVSVLLILRHRHPPADRPAHESPRHVDSRPRVRGAGRVVH